MEEWKKCCDFKASRFDLICPYFNCQQILANPPSIYPLVENYLDSVSSRRNLGLTNSGRLQALHYIWMKAQKGDITLSKWLVYNFNIKEIYINS